MTIIEMLWSHGLLIFYSGRVIHFQNKNWNYLHFQVSVSSHSLVVFVPVGLSSFLRHLLQDLLGIQVSSIAWFGQLTVVVQITDFFNLLGFAVSSVARPGQLIAGVQITDWGEKSVHWVVLSCDDIIEIKRTSDLNSNGQLPRPGDSRNPYTQQDLLKML